MTNWPPCYKEEYNKKLRLVARVRKNPALAASLHKYYSKNPVAWINDWCVTYNPRNTSPTPKKLPFILFPKQVEFIEFLHSCVKDKQSGLVEKSRDVGVSWLCCAFADWCWLYLPGSSVGFGSRKEMLVDRAGDPDSLFEKMRMIIRSLPDFMIPFGFNERLHMPYLKIINPVTGATITGEAGSNIGRGGRKTIYFKDESAHYERPELIEAALGDNTDVQIDVSSVNGTNNVFYNRRMSGVEWEPGCDIPPGKVRVFLFDWRDHPLKTQEWYDIRRSKAESEGLLHLFAQEVDRDYTSALDRVIIPAKYIKAAIDAHKKLGFEASGLTIGGQDVADEGGDKHALAVIKGPVVLFINDWGEGDGGEAAAVALNKCKEMGANEIYYDSIGVGAGFKVGMNALKAKGELPGSLRVQPWNAGAKPLNPERRLIQGDMNSPLIGDFFISLRVQAWWNLRTRFEKTYKAINNGDKYPPEELISLPSGLNKLHQLTNELSQATMTHNTSGKMVIDKKPDGGKSPNLADSLVIAFTPTRKIGILDVL